MKRKKRRKRKRMRHLQNDDQTTEEKDPLPTKKKCWNQKRKWKRNAGDEQEEKLRRRKKTLDERISGKRINDRLTWIHVWSICLCSAMFRFQFLRRFILFCGFFFQILRLCGIWMHRFRSPVLGVSRIHLNLNFKINSISLEVFSQLCQISSFILVSSFLFLRFL